MERSRIGLLFFQLPWSTKHNFLIATAISARASCGAVLVCTLHSDKLRAASAGALLCQLVFQRWPAAIRLFHACLAPRSLLRHVVPAQRRRRSQDTRGWLVQNEAPASQDRPIRIRRVLQSMLPGEVPLTAHRRSDRRPQRVDSEQGILRACDGVGMRMNQDN